MASQTDEQAGGLRAEPVPSLLHDRDFLRLWAGQSLSQVGAQITYLALPLAAVVLLGATAAEMGVLSALVRLPMTLFLLFGVLVDRVRKHPVLVWSDLGRAAVLALVPVLYFADRLTMAVIYVVVFVLGVLNVLFQVAYRTYLPHLLRQDQLADGNGKLQTTESLAQAVGPGLVGGLVKVMATPVMIIIDIATYLFSAAALTRIRRREEPPAADDESARSVHRAIWEGARWVFRQPLIRPLALASAVYSFLVMGAMQSIYILFLVRGGPGLDPAWIGVIGAAGGLGAVLGAATATRVTRRIGIGPALLFSTVVGNSALFLLPLAGGPVWAAVAMLTVSQFVNWTGNQVFIVNNMTLLQSVTPRQIQGRIMATFLALGMAPAPLGALGAGLLGEALGLRWAIGIIVVVGAVAPMVLLRFSPVHRLREIPAPLAL